MKRSNETRKRGNEQSNSGAGSACCTRELIDHLDCSLRFLALRSPEGGNLATPDVAIARDEFSMPNCFVPHYRESEFARGIPEFFFSFIYTIHPEGNKKKSDNGENRRTRTDEPIKYGHNRSTGRANRKVTVDTVLANIGISLGVLYNP